MPSAVVLVIDRLGAPHLGPYGNTWIDTPAMNSLASQSLLAEHALIDTAELADVYRSLWLGWHPLAAGNPADDGDEASLPASLKWRGIETELVTDEPQVAGLSLARHFSRSRALAAPSAHVAATDVHRTGVARFFAAAVEALRHIDDSTLLWLHCQGMAGPWDAPLDFRCQFVDDEDPAPPDSVHTPACMLDADQDPDILHGTLCAYAGQVALVDLCLDALLDVVRDHPLADELLVVLTASRGFPLGEHRCVGQAQTLLYRELIHVPLLIRHPELRGATHRLAGMVQPRDLCATLADWFDIGGENRHDSLWNESLQGKRTAAASRSQDQWAVRTPAWFARFPALSRASEQDPACELYLKPDDAWEVNDVSDRCQDVAGEIYGLLSQLRRDGADLGSVRLSEVLLHGID